MKKGSFVLGAAALFVSVVPTMAGIIPIPIDNSSFEAPDAVGVNAFIIGTAPTGFAKGADVGVHNGGEIGAPAAQDGSQIAFLGNGTNFTNLYKDITSAVIGDPSIISYTLTVGLARRTVDGNTNGTINVGLHDFNSGNAGLVFTPVSRSVLTTTGFQDFSVTLSAITVAPGDALRVFLDKTSGNSLIITDNWRLVANTVDVPEPSAAGLLGVAGVGLVRRRRR